MKSIIAKCCGRTHRFAFCVLALAALVLGGCNRGDEPDEGLATTKNGLHSCSVAGQCSLRVPIVNGAQSAQVALFADKQLFIGDGAQVLDGDGKLIPIVNAGDVLTRVGDDARVGKVVSYASVFVERDAFVEGDVVSARHVHAHFADIAGETRENVDLGPAGQVSWPVLFPASSGGDVDVDSGNRSLPPGRYGRVSVDRGGFLRLSTGTYYLESLDLDAGAELALDNAQGSVIVYVQSSVDIDATLSETGARGDWLIGFLGSRDVNLDGPMFRGTVIAPDAKLRLGSPGKSIEGVFVARTIDVARGVKLTLLPGTGTGPAAEALAASVVIVDPTGPTPVPMPTDWGDTTQEWSVIFGNYVQALVDAGYNGPTLVLPTPSFGLSSSFVVPPAAPSMVVSGPGGLLPLDADVTNLRGLGLGPDDGPAPSPNNVHFQFPGDGPYFTGNDEFGGGFFVEGDLDANQVRQAGFYTHMDASIALKGRLFGHDFDAARAIVWEDTETEHVNADGTSTPRVEAGVQVFVGPIKVFDKSVNKIEVYDENLVEEEASLLPDGVPPPIPIAGFVTIQPGAKGRFLVNLKGELAAAGPTLTLTPSIGVFGTAEVGINAVIIKVVVELSLALIEVNLPVDLRLRWSINETPDVCQADIEWDAGFKVVWKTLHGEIRLIIKIGIDLWFIKADKTILDQKLVSFDIVPEVSTPRVSIVPDSIQGIKTFDLDPQQCRFGSLLCAKAGIPAFTLDSWEQHETRDTGATPVGANYGQAACPDQYLIELGLGERPGVWMAGNWSVSLPAVPCDYEGVLTLYGFNSGTSQWDTLDLLRTQGELSGGVCVVRVVSRLAQLPPDASPDAPYSLVAPNLYPKMRAAIFAGRGGQKVPIHVDWFWPTP